MRPRLIIPIGLCLVAGLAVVVPASPVAAEDEDMLGRPTADVAFIPRSAGSSPDLLTLRADGNSPTEATLALLRRDAAGWGVVNHSTISIARPFEQANLPWIVELGDGRFAILATSQNQPVTVIVPVTVDERTVVPTFTIDEPSMFEGNQAGSAAADVDGDGTRELIISRWIDGDENGRCVDNTISVYHRVASGLQQTEIAMKLNGVKTVRLEGTEIGEFDGRPGADLLTNAYDSCGPSADVPDRHHLVAMRLADGSIIQDLPSSEVDSGRIIATAPMIVDIDGDGRDEAVVRGASGFALIDPTNRWARLGIEAGEVPPLAVRGGNAGSRPALVTWVAPLAAPDARIWSTRIERIGGALVTVRTTSAPYPELPPDSIGAGPNWPLVSGGYGGPTNAAVIDLDRDGCPELVLPTATADCLGTGAIQPGPAWLNARPLDAYETPDGPRLLVAEGLEWYPYEEIPIPPIPSAAALGAWRAGWVQPFFLAEVALPLDVGDKPVPAPVVDPLTDASGSIDLDGPPTTRLFLRASPLRTNDPATEGPRRLDEFLRTNPADYELVVVRQFPASGGVGPGSAMSRIPFDILSEAPSSSDGTSDRWSVSAVVVDARGVPSAVSRATVVHDTTAPVLTLDEAPLVSPPWPFEARITGTSEPGATVQLDDRPPVVADATGAFEFITRLAPWPQTLRAVAVDPSGNRTPASISVMGGIDLRGFPWPAIAAVAILVAVLLSALRGTRRVRSVPSMAVYGDDGGDLVIEEIDPGSRYQRD
jgi:hypothetical protein